MKRFTGLVIAALALSSWTSANAETVGVGSMANIYGSGHSGGAATPSPAPGGGGGGTAPPSVDVLGTTQFGFFASGSVQFSPSQPVNNTPDGPVVASTTFNGFNGLSGFTSDHAYALYGVFVGAVEPADPQPAAIDFTANTSFSTLSPLLDQVFYIGDGLTGTGSGATQAFNVPTGALKLFFGLADGINNPINIENGYYGDNSGVGYTVDIFRLAPAAVPLPMAAWSGIALLGSLATTKRLKIKYSR